MLMDLPSLHQTRAKARHSWCLPVSAISAVEQPTGEHQGRCHRLSRQSDCDLLRGRSKRSGSQGSGSLSCRFSLGASSGGVVKCGLVSCARVYHPTDGGVQAGRGISWEIYHDALPGCVGSGLHQVPRIQDLPRQGDHRRLQKRRTAAGGLKEKAVSDCNSG